MTLFAADAEPLSEVAIIPVEILSVAPETNVSAAIRRPEKLAPEPEPEIMTSDAPMENALEAAEETVQPPAEPPVEKVAEIPPEPDLTEDAIPVPEPETQPEPEPETPSFDLDAIAGLIDKTRETAPEANQQIATESERTAAVYDDAARRMTGEGNGLTADEATLVANAMYDCWRMPAAATDAENLRVRLKVRLVIGGHVESVELIDKAASRRLSPGNEYWDVAERSAIAAVNKCAPYDFLPESRYGIWRELTLNLRPQL